MKLDSAVDGQIVERSNFLQIGAELTAVADGNFDEARGRGRNFFGAMLAGTKKSFDLGVIDLQRVEFDQKRTVSGLQIAQPGRRLGLQETEDANDAAMRGQRDLLAKIDEQGLVACSAESQADLLRY